MKEARQPDPVPRPSVGAGGLSGLPEAPRPSSESLPSSPAAVVSGGHSGTNLKDYWPERQTRIRAQSPSHAVPDAGAAEMSTVKPPALGVDTAPKGSDDEGRAHCGSRSARGSV